MGLTVITDYIKINEWLQQYAVTASIIVKEGKLIKKVDSNNKTL